MPVEAFPGGRQDLERQAHALFRFVRRGVGRHGRLLSGLIGVDKRLVLTELLEHLVDASVHPATEAATKQDRNRPHPPCQPPGAIDRNGELPGADHLDAHFRLDPTHPSVVELQEEGAAIRQGRNIIRAQVRNWTAVRLLEILPDHTIRIPWTGQVDELVATDREEWTHSGVPDRRGGVAVEDEVDPALRHPLRQLHPSTDIVEHLSLVNCACER
jgi:hypothetical protein